MSRSSLPLRIAPVAGILLGLVGLSVFLIRFQHAGPYGLPAGGNLLAAILALGIGGLLLWAGLPSAVRVIALGVSPIILFFALYATLAELEEVVVVKAVDRAGEAADLRLWVIDHEGAPWVTMPRSKADAHALGEGPSQWLRGGQNLCILPVRFPDRETTNRIHHLRAAKYAVQRLATSIGLFGADAAETTIALRMDPCP